MQKADSPQGKRWWHAVFSLIVILVVVGDQFSKAWIRSNLAVGQSLPEGGFFRLTHIHNTVSRPFIPANYSFLRGYCRSSRLCLFCLSSFPLGEQYAEQGSSGGSSRRHGGEPD